MPSRRLWLEPGEKVSHSLDSRRGSQTYDEVFEKCAVRPEPIPLLYFIRRSLVVGQEIILTVLFLSCHRTASNVSTNLALDAVASRLQPSLVLVWLALFLVVLNNKPSDSDASQTRKTKVRHRAADGIFMAVVLRFLAAVLRTLTASYSSDTVHALAISSFVVHLLACDYSYANGQVDTPTAPVDKTKRPAFQGGTLSLTAAFFGTTLLASRFDSNLVVFIFVSSSVVLFALYPAARYQVSINTASKNKMGKIPVCRCFNQVRHPGLTTFIQSLL